MKGATNMTYGMVENIIEQIKSRRTQIGVEVRSLWSKGTVINKHESVVWNQNQVDEHNAKIERKIRSIRGEIGNLTAELNNSFEQLITETLKCSENTASRLYAYIVDIAENAKRNDSDDELEIRLEYTNKLLEIIMNWQEEG